MPIKETNCHQCNKPIKRYVSPSSVKERFFCSHKCHTDSNVKKVKIECCVCGKKLERIPSRIYGEVYCGLTCRHAAQRGGIVVNEDLIAEIREDYRTGIINKIKDIEEMYNVSQVTASKIMAAVKSPERKIVWDN